MSQSKETQLKLIIPAGKANPAPPVGPALGQRGVNIKAFCDQFNLKTSGFKPGTPVPVIIYVKKDKSFTFVTKTPPTSYLILDAINLKSGSKLPGRDVAGKIEMSKVEEIAKLKMDDMGASSLQAAMNTVAGTVRSMGLEIQE